MSNNIKIARKLMKLAKEIMSSENVADKPGEYENFTGKIDYKDDFSNTKVFGIVKNAYFTLLDDDNYPIRWYDGTWKKGTWEDGLWLKGTWEDGTWKYGWWEGGEWKNGGWHDGTWKKGNWIEGWDGNGDIHYDNPNKW